MCVVGGVGCPPNPDFEHLPVYREDIARPSDALKHAPKMCQMTWRHCASGGVAGRAHSWACSAYMCS